MPGPLVKAAFFHITTTAFKNRQNKVRKIAVLIYVKSAT